MNQEAVPFPTVGVVAERAGLILAWPESHEYDELTGLRNQEEVKRWFLDQRPIDILANRKWLSQGMRRGEEGLLSIRLASTGELLGTIGWTGYSPETRSACFGRLMVDTEKAAALRTGGVWHGGSIGLAAALILRDYAFTTMDLSDLTTWYFRDNVQAARINAAVGMKMRGQGMRHGRGGTLIPTVELSITREEWLAIASST